MTQQTILPESELPVKEEKGWPVKTKSGYWSDEVASALQKAVRRGEEKEAMFWVKELYDSGFWNYTFKRMAVMASEDIGLANPMASVLINSLYSLAERQAKGSRWPTDLLLFHGVMYLCRSEKSRVVDYAGGYILKMRENGWKPEVPEYAADQHTKSGRAKGLGDKEFFEEGAKIANKKWIEGEEFYRDACLEMYGFKGLERDENVF